MKWIKLETGFWDSETACLLERKFGAKGLLIYLRILAAIGKEIHERKDVIHAHENGWTKSLKDWSLVCKVRVDSFHRVVVELHTLRKLIAILKDNKMLTLKFKNIHEFVDERAMSSKERSSFGCPSGDPGGIPTGAYRREESINSKKESYVNQIPAPIGDLDRARKDRGEKRFLRLQREAQWQAELAKSFEKNPDSIGASSRAPSSGIGSGDKGGEIA